MAGVESGLWSVKGGNKKVPEELAKHAKVKVIQGEVKSVTLLEYQDANYEVRYLPAAGKEVQTKEYDLLFIATPMHDGMSNIAFEDFPRDIHNFPQKFHTTVATFVDGSPNSTFYGYDDICCMPEDILICKKDFLPNSYGKQSDVNGESAKTSTEDKFVAKIFTNRPPSEAEVKEQFSDVKDIRMIDWKAYPEYNFDIDSIPPFVLHDNMYYINSIEMAASAMEMSVIGARNVALLSYNHWHGHLDKIDEPYRDPNVKDDKAEL